VAHPPFKVASPFNSGYTNAAVIADASPIFYNKNKEKGRMHNGKVVWGDQKRQIVQFLGLIYIHNNHEEK
jgi:hypothetical protein